MQTKSTPQCQAITFSCKLRAFQHFGKTGFKSEENIFYNLGLVDK